MLLVIFVIVPSAARGQDSVSQTCAQLGFKPGTKGHTDCVNQNSGAGSGKAAPKSVNAAPATKAPVVPELTAAQREDKFWDGAMAAGNKEGFDAYLESYPSGRYLSMAKANLASLKAALEAAVAQKEDKFWDDAKALGNKEAYQGYLNSYPSGRYVDLAKGNITRLEVASRPPIVLSAAKLANSSPGMVFKDCPDCPEMVVIPAGRFVMGAAPGEEESEKLTDNLRNRSQPQHGVDVGSFSAGKFEVTRGQYRAFAEATGRSSTDGCFVWTGAKIEKDLSKDWRNPGYAQDDPHPVSCVSWDDAKAYTVWLSQRAGKAYRLLTEAEWEYAARAGTTTKRFWGDYGDQSCAYANGADQMTLAQLPGWKYLIANCNDRYAYTAPVGSYRANAFGLYDMLGNVSEWTDDCWNENYSGAPTDGNAWTTGTCSQRVVRGGSWIFIPRFLRSANRNGGTTAIRNYNIGFRVARTD